MVQFIFGLRKAFFWFGLWGCICFILGYALHGHIWSLLEGAWKALFGG